MRISDWSSAVCSSDLRIAEARVYSARQAEVIRRRSGKETAPMGGGPMRKGAEKHGGQPPSGPRATGHGRLRPGFLTAPLPANDNRLAPRRSEEHTSELQSLMRISYAVFCLKKKTENQHHDNNSR